MEKERQPQMKHRLLPSATAIKVTRILQIKFAAVKVPVLFPTKCIKCSSNSQYAYHKLSYQWIRVETS